VKIVFKFFVGCDTHKAEHSVCIIDQTGKILESFPIKNNLEGWMKALNVFQKYENILVGIENHANYAKLFSKFLIKHKIPLKEVNPVFTGKTRKASTKRDKTDEIDAYVVAKITRDERDYLPNIAFDDRQEKIKLISKQRDDAVEEKVRLVNRLHSKLFQIDTLYKQRYGKDISSPNAIELMEKDYEKLDDVQSTLIRKDIKRLKGIIEEILELNLLMDENSDSLTKNLDSISGIAIITAFKLVALIGDISKFKNENNFASYVGASPVKFASGSYSKTVKNRGGRKSLHCLMMQITRTQKKHDPEAKKYFEKKLSEGKTEDQAMISLQRKIVKIIYQIYKHNKPYDYQKHQQDKTLQNNKILQAA
jgi:transposase